MQVVSVAGYRKTGKTSLIESLLEVFEPDAKVATVKSLHHDVEFDTEGADTHRHRTAGADVVIGVTPSLTAEFRTGGKADGISVFDQLSLLDDRDIDWVIVEGFKEADLPTILVGDIEESAVGGPVVFRVADGTTVDGEVIRDKIETVPDYSSEQKE